MSSMSTSFFPTVFQQVLDRVRRMTQGDLVMSMDQLLTKPRLGTCHKFYMQPFTLANSKKIVRVLSSLLGLVRVGTISPIHSPIHSYFR